MLSVEPRCPLCSREIRPSNMARHVAACHRKRNEASPGPGGWANMESQGVPLRPGNGRWATSEGTDRISPRECVKAAQEDMNKAWSSGDYFAAVIHVRGAVDWLRRALEQMVPAEEGEQR